MLRIALLYDSTPRPETTGFLVRRALGPLADVEQFLPAEFDALAAGHHGRFDLYLAVDDGLAYEIPPSLRPLAFWAIDTHLAFDALCEKARNADHLFAAQRDGAEQFQQAGFASAVWLPLACDPDFHRPHPVPKQFDVAFVGNRFPGLREERLQAIVERFPNTFIGQRYGHAMAETYSAARIVFNQSLANDVNMRVFEAVASGSLLVTNDLAENGMDDLFVPDQHLVTFRDTDDLLDRIAWFLAHPKDRKRIAADGRRHALQHHTYRHRVQTLLSTIATRQTTAVAVPEPPMPPSSASPAVVTRDPGYFEFARSEVLALIPSTATRVLDIGCGAGRLGQALKARQAAHVTGLEGDPLAAETARQRLDVVQTVDLDDDTLDFSASSFDAIVCADVLEHLRHPERLLKKLRRWLTPDGTLVASLPNVQHHSVVTSLLAGNFTYESAGLLDETHLRFFTRREIEKLFFRAGFDAAPLQSVPGPGDADWWNGPQDQVAVGGLRITGLDPERAREFHTYQYLVTATPAPPPKTGLTSIVLATFNQWDYTRLCLDSVRRFTDEPYELIVVDNGSTDGTPEFLARCPDVRLIRNAENRGFPAAVNQGIAVAQGSQILLLNNDTVVATGWLRRMLEALRSDSRIGLVGPVSNSVSGPQQVDVSYAQLAELDGFAWDWSRRHRNQIVDLDRLVGFCLLIGRPVIDAIGGLDERFGIGNFEDDDYCRRAREAGFRTVVAADSFVHHFGGRTFQGAGIDFAALMKTNQKLYEQKWAIPSLLPAVPPSRPPAIPPSPPRLSACFIVRDNERTIRPCLESLRPYVDELIVVDTGSTDRTPAICEERGAKLFHFPWCDDFSAARNESLKHATGDWIFWMDSDDTIPANCGEGLRKLVDGPHAENVLGYVMQVHCPASADPDESDVTVVDHVKLFRNRPDLRFEHRIHEQILPAIRRAGGDVAFTDLYVVHSGSDHTPAGRAKKLERDFRLLALDQAERPDHPFVLFNLGMTHADAGQHDQAIAALQRCLAVSITGESHLPKAHALLAASQAAIGQTEQALDTITQALAHAPDDPELRFRQAILLQQCGRSAEAEAVYRALLDSPVTRRFRSVDPGLTSFKARHNLACLCEEQSRDAEAESIWRELVTERPTFLAAWTALGELLLRQGRLDDADQLARQMSDQPAARTERARLTARIAELRGDAAASRTRLEAALADAPDDEPLLEAYCRLLFERFDLRDAEPSLQRIVRLKPQSAAGWHNLGAAQTARGMGEEAIGSFRRSLDLRPAAPSTAWGLGHLLAASGRRDEAFRVWSDTLARCPDAKELREALAQTFPPTGTA